MEARGRSIFMERHFRNHGSNERFTSVRHDWQSSERRIAHFLCGMPDHFLGVGGPSKAEHLRHFRWLLRLRVVRFFLFCQAVRFQRSKGIDTIVKFCRPFFFFEQIFS